MSVLSGHALASLVPPAGYVLPRYRGWGQPGAFGGRGATKAPHRKSVRRRKNKLARKASRARRPRAG